MKIDRRNFFSTLALGVGATAFPNFLSDFENLKEVQAGAPINKEELTEGSIILKVSIGGL